MFDTHYKAPPALVKVGYPPHPLTLIPELPLESLGLKQGEQLILTQKPSQAPQHTSSSRPTNELNAPRANLGQPTSPPQKTKGPVHVPVDGGYLVHRVR